MNASPVNSLSRTRSKSVNTQFKSPASLRGRDNERLNTISSTEVKLDITSESELLDILRSVKVNCSTLEEEINELIKEGFVETELKEHISKLHEYNEIKDVTQVVLGHLANLEGVTITHLHKRFNLNLKE